MDPQSASRSERWQAALHFDCSYCESKAGFRCVSSSGSYNEHLYVHADRLIAMYRDAYLARSNLVDWHQGFKDGKDAGWEEGVADARRAFNEMSVQRTDRGE